MFDELGCCAVEASLNVLREQPWCSAFINGGVDEDRFSPGSYLPVLKQVLSIMSSGSPCSSGRSPTDLLKLLTKIMCSWKDENDRPVLTFDDIGGRFLPASFHDVLRTMLIKLNFELHTISDPRRFDMTNVIVSFPNECDHMCGASLEKTITFPVLAIRSMPRDRGGIHIGGLSFNDAVVRVYFNRRGAVSAAFDTLNSSGGLLQVNTQTILSHFDELPLLLNLPTTVLHGTVTTSMEGFVSFRLAIITLSRTTKVNELTVNHDFYCIKRCSGNIWEAQRRREGDSRLVWESVTEEDVWSMVKVGALSLFYQPLVQNAVSSFDGSSSKGKLDGECDEEEVGASLRKLNEGEEKEKTLPQRSNVSQQLRSSNKRKLDDNTEGCEEGQERKLFFLDLSSL